MKYLLFASLIALSVIAQTFGARYGGYGRYDRYDLDGYRKGYVGPGEYYYDNDYGRYGRYGRDYDRYGSRRLYGSHRGLGLGGYSGYRGHPELNAATKRLAAALLLKGLVDSGRGYDRYSRYGYDNYKK